MHILQFSFLFFFCCCYCILLVESKWSSINVSCSKQQHNISIGVVMDERSRMGKEQRIAMKMAAHDFRGCMNLVLHFKDSHGSSSRAASAAIDLVNEIQVHAILGTISLQEAAILSELKTTNRSIPVIALSPTASVPQHVAPKSPFYIQMSSPITYQIQCIAAIISHFNWKRVILIHEQGTQDFGLITQLTDSLQVVDSSIHHHFTFPLVSSLLNPKPFVNDELKKLKSKTVKVFVVARSSPEFAVILFEEAKKLGMMEKGYVWIVSDDIANFIDSVSLPVILNMQGIIGFKTEIAYASEHLREFKSRFRRKYRSEYPEEEDENSTPSIYSLRAYDTIWSIALSLQNIEGKIEPTSFANQILSSDFEGLTGKINFKNGLLSQMPVFRIVNVIGKSYREVALWSPKLGFSDDVVKLDGKKMGLTSSLTGKLSSIYWPGDEQIVPKGWTIGSYEKPLRIGVPAKGAFNQFVQVKYDPYKNRTLITGFTIEVFQVVVKQLPYDLHYVFVPYHGSYDEMVTEVHNKSLDAAVGDTEIMADRYVYAEFSQPYIESGLVMVVTVKPGLKESKFIALNAFTMMMWIQLALMSMATGAVIWFSEYATHNEQFTIKSFHELISSVLWLSVTILSFSHRENIRNNSSKLVLATWICVVFVVRASFTAVLSTMMTVPRLQPSILDIDYLHNTNAAVGCNGNSFICRYLTDVLHFNPENVRKINSIHEYPKAFKNGDIKAAFFVAPHAKVFLAEYCKGYIISGPSFRLGGFGFVFPKGSPLAIDISEAILKVTQSGLINALEKNKLYFSNCTASTRETDDIKLGTEPFSGLFQILGCIILLAACIAIVRLLKMYCSSIHEYVQRELIRRRIGMWASLVLIDVPRHLAQT